MRLKSCVMRRGLVVACLVVFAIGTSTAIAQVKPGDTIGRTNAVAIQQLVSPGTYVAVNHGMELHIVASQRIDWPAPYQEATEKYSRQVRLSENHRDLLGYVAGQPFPI